jgi:DNA-binding XRE family transcriptional regulator
LALLGICSRTIVAQFPEISVYRRILKRAPTDPQTLGEHLRLARIDRGLKQTELADLLGVVYQTVVKWELNLIPISRKSRSRVVAFLGYDPAAIGANPTGDSVGA